ncbi:MAG: NYN domain-containing protein [Blastocatellales bacterium]|nr:NYN domain-containing protein [Blastocatellales bacterium]
MPFNTAIFYDIENLLKGYSFSQQMAANLSLEEIFGAIKQTERLSQVAVQRAYANWSDPRLAIMRGELNELGIEPIQVFVFLEIRRRMLLTSNLPSTRSTWRTFDRPSTFLSSCREMVALTLWRRSCTNMERQSSVARTGVPRTKYSRRCVTTSSGSPTQTRKNATSAVALPLPQADR